MYSHLEFFMIQMHIEIKVFKLPLHWSDIKNHVIIGYFYEEIFGGFIRLLLLLQSNIPAIAA